MSIVAQYVESKFVNLNPGDIVFSYNDKDIDSFWPLEAVNRIVRGKRRFGIVLQCTEHEQVKCDGNFSSYGPIPRADVKVLW